MTRIDALKDLLGLLPSLISYDAETGNLTWLERPSESFANEGLARHWNEKYSGQPALNCVHPTQGYKSGYIFGHTFKALRS